LHVEIKTKNMNKTVAVHLADGFEEIEAVSIIDVLRRAGIDTQVVSVTGNDEVTGSHNITIKADILLEDIDYDNVEMIILPGGMPGAKNLKKHEKLGEQILRFHQQDKHLAAICAAPIVFGSLGILNNRKATCYPGYEDQLAGANVTGAAVEVSDKIITGKGAGVAIQFALKIVEVLESKELADEIAEKMIAET
jgi:protein deglycase